MSMSGFPFVTFSDADQVIPWLVGFSGKQCPLVGVDICFFYSDIIKRATVNTLSQLSFLATKRRKNPIPAREDEGQMRPALRDSEKHTGP